MIKKLLAALFCLSVVSVLSIGVVGCGDKKDPVKKDPAEKKDADPKKTT
jgi:hypothetical protein